MSTDPFVRRSVAQSLRRDRERRQREELPRWVLVWTRDRGLFELPIDLKLVSMRAGWGPHTGPKSTGRAFTQYVLPHERAGFLAEKRDEDGKLVGYTLTPAGLRELQSE